jgi:ABC-type antimicrobial peptide transport system permease subunit
MVLRDTLLVVATGLAVGLPLSWLGTRLLGTQLYGLSTHDPGTMAAAVLFIAAVTVAAGFVPARRASHVDPLTALRYE